MKSFRPSLPICRSFTLCVLMAPILAACGSTLVWVHSDKDQGAFNKDRYECENDAANYMIARGYEGDEDRFEERVGQCLEIRGYKQVPPGEVPPGTQPLS